MLKAIWCWLAHGGSHVYSVYAAHHWQVQCEKCGHWRIESD